MNETLNNNLYVSFYVDENGIHKSQAEAIAHKLAKESQITSDQKMLVTDILSI